MTCKLVRASVLHTCSDSHVHLRLSSHSATLFIRKRDCHSEKTKEREKIVEKEIAKETISCYE